MIHGDNPFADDVDSRDPVRRFRGRLTAPVTIVTSGDAENMTGLTVSSLMVIEGEPGQIEAVVGPTTDLWELVAETGRFVVHICGGEHRSRAEVFAGLRPNPGGIFTGLSTQASDWGPIIDDMANRLYCTLQSQRLVGFSGLVSGAIDRAEIANLDRPLAYFRGKYHTFG